MTNNTIPNVPRELLERASNLAFQTQHYPLHEELRAILSAQSPADVDGLEVVRKACEAANCKYPEMDAMADFKRDVTPSVVIGLLDGIRHAKGIAAINDARANGCAETAQFLRLELSDATAIIDGLRGEVGAQRVKTCTALKERNDARKERDAALAECERLRMQLAACGVVALSNTIESAGKARQMHPDYMSASCSDVAGAVDREIALRTERDQQAQRIGELEGLLREAREFAAAYVSNSFFGHNARKTLARIDAALSSGKDSD